MLCLVFTESREILSRKAEEVNSLMQELDRKVSIPNSTHTHTHTHTHIFTNVNVHMHVVLSVYVDEINNER